MIDQTEAPFTRADAQNIVGFLNSAGPIANLTAAAQIAALRDRFWRFAVAALVPAAKSEDPDT